MEENGSLAIGEKGCRNGQVPQIHPHPNFRLFLTMDPREGELSPAMRNRGIEIFVPSTDPQELVISGEKIIRHDHSYLLLRQFEISKSCGFMGERCLISFLSCAIEDWQSREYLIQKYLKSFQHPLRQGQKDMFELLVVLELEILMKAMRATKLSKNEIAKQLWQHFGRILTELGKQCRFSRENWIAICQCSSLISQIGNFLKEYLDETAFKSLSVMWKNLKELFDKLEFNANFEAIEDALEIKTNLFEPLAIEFQDKFQAQLEVPQENLSQIQNLEDLVNHEKLLKNDDFALFPYLLERVLTCQDFANHFDARKVFQLAEKLVANDNLFQLFESLHESPTLVRDEYLSLFKILLQSDTTVCINKAKNILQSLDKMSKILHKSRFCLNNKQIEDMYLQDQISKALASLNQSLPMSENVKKVLKSPNETSNPLKLVKLGLLAIHIAAERSDIDIAEQMQIESKLKTTFQKSLHNDLIALDSCQALFPVTQDRYSTRPDQVTRRTKIAQLSIEIQDLEQRQPIRQDGENYSDLITELRQNHQNTLALKTIEKLVEDLEKANNELQRNSSVMKVQVWFKSLLTFMHKIPANFKSYQDIWTPLLWGCANVIIGVMNYRKSVALSWRQNALEQFDEFRKISKFRQIKNLTEVRDELCKEESKIDVMEEFTANIVSDKEQSIIKQVFQDHVCERKTNLNSAYMKNIDMEKIIVKIQEFVKEAFDIKDDTEEDDLEPFVADLQKSLDTCLTRSVFESYEKFMVPLERIGFSITEWNKNAVKHQIIPLKDLLNLVIGWRKSLHEWSNVSQNIETHMKSGVQKCLDSLLPFLQSTNKTLESFCVPFILFIHNSFVGDFNERLEKLKNLQTILRAEESDLAQYLNTIIEYYENFHCNIENLVSKKKRELKMQFEVQKKTNKRLYEDTHIRDHFKAANNICRETSKKLEEVCLAQSRTHFSFDKFYSYTEQMKFQVQNVQGEKEINEDVQLLRNHFVTRVQNFKVRIDLEDLEIWNQDVQMLAKDLQENKAKKLTFHVVKTKASNMLTSLKEMGLSKNQGCAYDIQLFRILQCLKSTPKQNLQILQSVFELEKLSSSMLLPVTSQSKAFAFCKLGQDLLSHGHVILLELAQALLKNDNFAKKVTLSLQVRMGTIIDISGNFYLSNFEISNSKNFCVFTANLIHNFSRFRAKILTNP